MIVFAVGIFFSGAALIDLTIESLGNVNGVFGRVFGIISLPVRIFLFVFFGLFLQANVVACNKYANQARDPSRPGAIEMS